MRFQVVVGNIGTVYDGNSAAEAAHAFAVYVEKCHENDGRAEWPVTMFRDGEVSAERDSYSCPFCKNEAGWTV